MASRTKQLRVFIAFPSDCLAERGAIRQVCQADLTIKHICRSLELSIDITDFSEVCPDAGRPQSIINAAADKLQPDWYIFLFWQRLGSDAGLGMTGMEEEWRRALKLNLEGGGRPWVSAYFNKTSPVPYETNTDQLEALISFKSSIKAKYEALIADFQGANDLRERFRADLSSRLYEFSDHAHPLNLKTQCQETSKGLLECPRTVGKGCEIERPELLTLMDRFSATESSTTLILGPPGSGKSALLSRVGSECLSKGLPVLAIKADMLGKTVRTPESLREWLHLSLETSDAIRNLAEKETVIVLIDQLDAVSELIDRHSGRLNVLLDLIFRLSGNHNVHIVASSREFEYQHDARLNNINADNLRLSLPTWESISPILESAGYQTAIIAEPTKELLRSPWNLKVFLDVAKPGINYSSVQALLEEVWDQKILIGDSPESRAQLLERLAREMTRTESLWVPIAWADRWLNVRLALEQKEILVKGPEGTTIGFRHQTYLDHTIARAFTSGSLSVSDYVRSKQDGLFVRPSMLSGLHYLRGTSRAEYHRQASKLLTKSFRRHIRTLVIEFLAEQKEPDEIETSLLRPLLCSEKEGPRVLAATSGSPGWFNYLSADLSFHKWLRKPPAKAIHCLNGLCLAIQNVPEKVLDILEAHWLAKRTHDELTLRVFSYLPTLNERAVRLISPVLRRHPSHIAAMLADRAIDTEPNLAPLLVRADLDGRLERARKIVEKLKRGTRLSPYEKQEAGFSFEGKNGPLIRLIEREEDWSNLDAISGVAPKPFLDAIWPWFMEVIGSIASEAHQFLTLYRDDTATYNEFEGELPQAPIIKALLRAFTCLAQEDPNSFSQFAKQYEHSDLLITHRFLARGFQIIAPIKPNVVLDYLLTDPRRLMIGDHSDSFRESKALIATVSRYLNPEDIKRLEDAVINFEPCRKVMPDWSAQERFDRSIWARRDRLWLLQSFPFDRMSEKAKSLRAAEERVIMGEKVRGSSVSTGWVGPRMTADEMKRAAPSDLLNLFSQLPDNTEWHNPKRQWSEDFSRAGGAVQQAREFGDFAKHKPVETVNLIKQLRPTEHETYAGAAIDGLAQTELPTSELVALILDLDQKGFSSGSFREGSARALKARAIRDNGLSETALALLKSWLEQHNEPVSDAAEQRQHQKRIDKDLEKGREILFGHSPIWISPHGRGPIIEAIADGYLRTSPPNWAGWKNVILSRLNKETHPAIWVVTLMRMPTLYNLGKKEATSVFDQVIRACPKVLGYNFALYPIANIIRLCEPKEIAGVWIKMLDANKSDFAQQAFGEMLFIYHCCYNDSWSKKYLQKLLVNGRRDRVHLGLAHGASHLWKQPNCRHHATKVLLVLARSANPLIIKAVGNVLRLNRDNFTLCPEMREIIRAIIGNRRALIATAEDLLEALAPFTTAESQLVLQICRSLVKLKLDKVLQYGFSSIAENLTNVVLTLHRQQKYRAVGLELFEALIEMNLREALGALEVLDRKPFRKIVPHLPRRRRRKAVHKVGL